MKLLVLSDRIDFDEEAIRFDYSVIQSNLRISLKAANKANLREFEKVVKEFEPDIIHSHLFESELLSRWKIFPKTTYVTHCHDNMSQISNFSKKKSLKKNITDFYEKKLLFKRYKDCKNNFITISRDTNDYIIKVVPKALRQNIFLLSNAIDFKRFYVEKRVVPKSDKLIHAVCVGSLVNKKNQKFLIPIAVYLKNKGYDCKIDVLGDGPNRESLQAQIDSNNLNGEITLHGNVKNVEEFMRNTDFYIHTATYEPFGLVLLEAMASRTPVISLDGGGNADIIKDKKNGFLIKEENAEIFGKTIMELQKNKSLYNSIVEEGFSTAKKHDIKEYIENLMSIYVESISATN